MLILGNLLLLVLSRPRLNRKERLFLHAEEELRSAVLDLDTGEVLDSRVVVHVRRDETEEGVFFEVADMV
jgi:hypothetical protein